MILLGGIFTGLELKTRNGLLYLDGKQMDCGAADSIARTYFGLAYAEQVVAKLKKEQAPKVIEEVYGIMLEELDEDERMAVMERFCKHCGILQGKTKCQCWNDE
jgi:hypothetical protein